MSELLARAKVPGVIPVLVLSGLTLYVAWYLPELAPWLPFLFLGVSILANTLAPDDPRVLQLVAMLRALIPLQPAPSRDIRMTSGPDAPERSTFVPFKVVTEKDVDKVLSQNRMSKILWG